MENGTVLSVTSKIAGTQGLYHLNGMTFPVILLDVRKIWGRVDVLVSPVNGQGEKWVEQTFITLP